MTRFGALLIGFALILASCMPLGEEGTSISRGDQAFADGDMEEALAEYRLAERQGADDADTYARIAHTYVALRRIDGARDYYRLAVDRNAGYTEQAVADFVRLAREEEAVRDEFGMASAVQTAQEFRPGISLDDLALPLARHYSRVGEYGRALPFYLKTLSALGDSIPRILFETAVAYDEVGDCQSAVVYYEDYRDRLPNWRRSEVDWRLGNCSFRLAAARREEGEEEEALRHLERLLRIGEPRSLQAMGYFEKGEILGLRGECEAALEAFIQVPALDPSGNSPLVARAEERIDQIRFGSRAFRDREDRAPGDPPLACFPPDRRDEEHLPPPRRGG
ncbi:MAG: tetratricopeptide repeat protein [Longimicrobiales bacterium]